MPIKLTYVNGMQRVVEGESWKRLDENSARIGAIDLKSIPEGLHIVANKPAIAEVEEIPQATWDMWIAADKKRQEDAEAAKKKAAEDRARAELAAIEARKLKNRIKRLFRKRP